MADDDGTATTLISILSNLEEMFESIPGGTLKLESLTTAVETMRDTLRRSPSLPRSHTGQRIITLLLRIVLNQKNGDDERCIVLLSRTKSTEVIQTIASLCGGSDGVISSMIEAVSSPGVGMEFLQSHVRLIIKSWFTLPGGQILETKPGFMEKLFIFLDLCGDRQNEACGHRKYHIDDLDDAILPVVCAALRRETRASMAAVDGYGRTVLHRALALHRLPRVITALLQDDKVDVNAPAMGMSPLAWMLYTSTKLKQSHLDAAALVLAHPRLDLSSSATDDPSKVPLMLAVSHMDKEGVNYKLVGSMVKLLGDACIRLPNGNILMWRTLERLLQCRVTESNTLELSQLIKYSVENLQFSILDDRIQTANVHSDVLSSLANHPLLDEQMCEKVIEACINNLTAVGARSDLLLKSAKMAMDKQLLSVNFLGCLLQKLVNLRRTIAHWDTATALVCIILDDGQFRTDRATETIKSVIKACEDIIAGGFVRLRGNIAADVLLHLIKIEDFLKDSVSVHQIFNILLKCSQSEDDQLLEALTAVMKHSRFTVVTRYKRTIIHTLFLYMEQSGLASLTVLSRVASMALEHGSVTHEVAGKLFIDLLNSPPDGAIRQMAKALLKQLIKSGKITMEKTVSLGGTTAIDFVLTLLEQSTAKHDLLFFSVEQLGQHPSVTTGMIHKALAKIILLEGLHENERTRTSTVLSLASNIDANQPIRNGMTIGHLAAISGNIHLTLAILRWDRFDVMSRDGEGNPVMFHVSTHFPTGDVKAVLGMADIAWDFDATNSAGQNITAYYKAVKGSDDMVVSVLNYLKAASPIVEDLPEIRPKLKRQVILETQPRKISRLTVTKSTWVEFDSKKRYVDRDEMYNTHEGSKGKACIIAIYNFDRLHNLEGYRRDVQDLKDLWGQVGLEIVMPIIKGDPSHAGLTGKELKKAVEDFAAMLTSDDKMAVLCILSHGGEGLVFGRDGGMVETQTILQEFSNINCSKMAGKPKIVIVQACQGESSDHGVVMRHAGSDTALTLNDPVTSHFPFLSDMIICCPSLPGFASFVGREAHHGSVYIKHLVKVFNDRAHDEDINTLLTIVNKKVSTDIVLAEEPGTRQVVPNKQMSNFLSCLTKLLYLWPGLDVAEETLVKRPDRPVVNTDRL